MDEETLNDALDAVANTSSSRESVDALLADLAHHGGPVGLKLDEMDMAQVQTETGAYLTMRYREAGHELVVAVDLPNIVKPSRAVLLKLLEVNADPQVTAGGVVAAGSGEQPFVFYRRLPAAGIAPQGLLDQLGTTIEIAEVLDDWGAILTDMNDAAVKKAAMPTAQTMMMRV